MMVKYAPMNNMRAVCSPEALPGMARKMKLSIQSIPAEIMVAIG
jgi:hypothetical protein